MAPVLLAGNDAAANFTPDQVEVVTAARDIVLSPGGAVAIILVLLGALVYRRLIPKGAHDAEMASQKEAYEKAIADRDKTIEKLERRAERWEQYALFGRRELRATLDEVGAPPLPAPPRTRDGG